jgi:hypothetical protein
MKSHVGTLLGAYKALLRDYALQYPSYHVSARRDYSRLSDLVKSRGLEVLLVDLPNAGKQVDLAFSRGHLTLQIPCFGTKSKRGIIPRLFAGIFSRVFDRSGLLRDCVDPKDIWWLRQVLYLCKKTELPCSTRRIIDSVDEFFLIEESLPTPTWNWDLDDLGTDVPVSFLSSSVQPELLEVSQPCSPHEMDTLQQVCDIVTSSFGEFDPMDLRTKHGPGAVSDRVSGGSKYDFPYWPRKLDSVFWMDHFSAANTDLFRDRSVQHDSTLWCSNHELPSKLIAVPKTAKGPRLIASETIAYQWCQQAVKDFLRDRVRQSPISNAIDFTSQQKNQRLALSSSLDKRYATVDLSSASDRLSLWVVERTFRRNLTILSCLHATRSRWIWNPISNKRATYSRLRKYAPQGNATTFPVQSIFYACAAIASLLADSHTKVTTKSILRASKEVQVFGDDTIIPTESLDTFTRILECLHFKVNQDKTHYKGNFRESCGCDAYSGVDVTPVYFTKPSVAPTAESLASAVQVSNNFYMKGLFSVSRMLKTLCERQSLRLPFVPKGSGVLGWYSAFGYDPNGCYTRWNQNLQRIEIKMSRLSVKQDRIPLPGASALLQYFTDAPAPTTMWKAGEAQRSKPLIGLGWVPIFII